MLEPIPDLEFDPSAHRYRYLGEFLPYSVTGVLSYDMPEHVKQRNKERNA